MLGVGQTNQYDGTKAVDVDVSDIDTGGVTAETEADNVCVLDSDAALAGLNSLDFSASRTNE